MTAATSGSVEQVEGLVIDDRLNVRPEAQQSVDSTRLMRRGTATPPPSATVPAPARRGWRASSSRPQRVDAFTLTPEPAGLVESADGGVGPAAVKRGWVTAYFNESMIYQLDEHELVVTHTLGQIRLSRG